MVAIAIETRLMSINFNLNGCYSGVTAARETAVGVAMKEFEKDRVAAFDRLAVESATARFSVGEIVRHRTYPFRGVIFDVDPQFANSDEWLESIPEDDRPAKDQPFYHLLAENDESSYVAYVSQQNLEHDDSDLPLHHPALSQIFNAFEDGRYILKREHRH